ncbi:hypothetical protein KPH14_007846 [Odynerus spinipes]|uniref:Uncharacterized protein n=1 Tax=Odynerus spinipes TaxID=1348599 RepID=A0AAD9VWF3_9HYME|nr:hypothetical protein KPH14_007846 [Odynerus spinipes]
MSTTNETARNYKSIDSDKENNNNNVMNTEERSDKNGSDVKQQVHQDQINSIIQKENTLSNCKENTSRVDIVQQVNSIDNPAQEKSNDQDTEEVGVGSSTNKAVKKKLKKQRQRLRKKVEKIDQVEETKTDVTEAIKADSKEHKLQEEKDIKADSPTTSENLNQNNIHNEIENNNNSNDDSDEEIDFLTNIPAFVHAAIKKDNKKPLSIKVYKKSKEDDTKVNFRQKTLSLETLNNNDDEYYDIDVESDFTLVKYKHPKHPNSLQSSEDYATLAINLILEDQISEAIQHLSTAISLDPKNTCHYANRSFCFLRIGAYSLAIRDANFVIRTTSNDQILAKANYLVGEAYYGLKNYEEAEKSIQKCLDLFPRNLCYIRESLRFKISQLVNMGFCERDALLTLKNHSTVMDALETLIAENNIPKTNNNSTNDCGAIILSYDENEIFYSDDEDNCNCTQDRIPTQTEVGLHLGSPLAQTLFIYDHQETKKLLGIIPPLKCIEGELWISPRAQINTKVLSLPENSNIIKECTHLGILDLGESLLNRSKAEIEASIGQELEKQLIDQRYLCEAEKRRAIKINTEEIHETWKKYINVVECDMQKELQVELAKVIVKCNKEIQKMIVEQRINMTQHMLSKVRNEMSYIVDSLYKESEETRRMQIENIIADINEIIRKERIESNKKIEKLKKEKTESLHIQKMKFKTKNVADIMYILCLERLHSNLEKQRVQNYFEKQICNLHNVVLNLKNILDLSKETILQYQNDNEMLKEKLHNINQEFHKFVTFVFNSVPKQSEFVFPPEFIYLQEMNQTLHESLDKE